MTLKPYPDEAPGSVLMRWAARGRVARALGPIALQDDLQTQQAALMALRQAGASDEVLELTDALALERRWPLLAADDLDRPAEGSDRLGKACEFCLAEDSAEGRDHYLRQDWRLAWRMSCRRHGSPLVDVETFDLVPVVIDGQRERRVRLLRDFEKTVDRFLRRARGGGFNRQIIPAAALCLEADIDAALDGRRLPALWCLGSDWPRARRSLIGLADLLLSPSRTGRERLIHYVADEDLIPYSHTQFFTTGGFPVLGSLWQRRILESCARLLIDPDRYEHLDQGRRYTPHADLLWGGGAVRAHGALGRMASADMLSTILAYARVEQIERLETNLPGMAKPLANRIRNAAAVALYIP
ncbi:TniQ family protein [Brevundimonas aurantiaca]|uniref:TniQ family protein n=1 Tax=Brevundimonas aurantiaca TaxID=74316 RepID=UPI001D1925B4|nr:TniQ family protein [Brevundimonas aurantiaca]MCC4292792.1 TniQ family protein [Brevundimonas aurantiaca]